jgi:uncharacterized protein YfbU (UPF0304 family)
MLKTNFYAVRFLYIARRLIGYSILSIIDYRNKVRYSEIIRGVKEGLKLAKNIRSKVGTLDLYKAPYVPVNIMDTIIEYVYPWKERKAVNFDMLRQPDSVDL